MTQTRIFQVLEEAGFPEGVINMVHGAKDAVNGMLYHPGIKGISFVGQTSTARYIYKACGRRESVSRHSAARRTLSSSCRTQNWILVFLL